MSLVGREELAEMLRVVSSSLRSSGSCFLGREGTLFYIGLGNWHGVNGLFYCC